MIDTLFYFVDTELEYRRLMQGENGTPGISPTTIVFVGDSREIYVNGKGYGKTSTNGLLASSEFDQWKGHLNDRIDNAINDASSANAIARQKAEEDLAAAMETIQGIIDDTSEEMSSDILAVQQQLQEAKEQLQANIDSANLNADEILSDLTTFQGTIRNELETSIRDAITNADGRTIWSELNTTNEGITAMTNRINKSLDANGDLKNTEVLQSIIDSGVKDNKAVTDIQNKWAVLDENQNLLEWVASGFRSEANKEGGLAAMFATAQDDTQNAIANVKTEIEQDVAGNYVASVDLASNVVGIVEDELNVESLSAIAMKNDVNQATTTITNRLNSADQDRQNIHTSLSQISSVAEEGKARASLLTSVDENGTYFINESSLDGAVNSMLAKSGSESAALIHQMAQADIAEADISAQIEDATSVLATKVSVEQVVNNLTGEIENRKTAVAGLQAQITGEDGLTNAIAGVNARVDGESAKIAQLTTWQENTDTWKAGVVTQSNKDGAIAALVASNSNSSTKLNLDATIVATVNEDSRVAIRADHVFIDSNKETTVGASLKDAHDDIDALEGTVAGHTASISELNTSVSKTSADLSAITTWKNNEEYKSGLVSSSGLDGAVAALFAEGTTTNGTVSSKISTAVNNGISNITLSADKVYIEGQQNVNIKSYFDSELDDAIDGVEGDITSLGNTVAGHTTSISEIDTKANNTASSLEALSTWKDGFVNTYKAGLVTETGLAGAMAQLIAENGDVKASITNRVKDDASEIELNADQIKLSGSTLADRIEATEGTIGGIAISEHSIQSNNGNFSVTDGGILTATGATISGAITATSLTLSGTSIHASSVSGLSDVATSGNYSSLNGTPTIPSKVSQLTNDSGFINSSALNGYALSSSIPKAISDLTGSADIVHTANITTEEKTVNGVKVKTISLGDGKSYTTISDNNGFVYTNVGVGTLNSNHNSKFFKVSSDGLLEADNAIIHGTVYANAGSFTGDVVANTLTAGDTDSMYIQTSANAIKFMSKGSDGTVRPVALFESDGNGLFFSVLDEHGDSYGMDWSQWLLRQGDYELLDGVQSIYYDKYKCCFTEDGIWGNDKWAGGHLYTKNGKIYTNYKYDAEDEGPRGANPLNGQAEELIGSPSSSKPMANQLYGKRIGTLRDVYPNAPQGAVIYVINPYYLMKLNPSYASSSPDPLYGTVLSEEWKPNAVVEVPIEEINVYQLVQVNNSTISYLNKYIYTSVYASAFTTSAYGYEKGVREDRQDLSVSTFSDNSYFDSTMPYFEENVGYYSEFNVYKRREVVLCEYTSSFNAQVIEKRTGTTSSGKAIIRTHITAASPKTIPASALMYLAIGGKTSYSTSYWTERTDKMKYDQVNITPVAAGTYF